MACSGTALLLTKYYYCDDIKKDAMGGSCSRVVQMTVFGFSALNTPLTARTSLMGTALLHNCRNVCIIHNVKFLL
jgi:hypothetical protein